MGNRISHRKTFLRMASEKYFWKPLAAFYTTFELEALSRIWKDRTLKRPVLDLGCGDGSYESLILRMLSFRTVDVGLDKDVRLLRKAVTVNGYRSTVLGWGERLPFRREAFGTVLCWKTLDAVQDLDRVLDEMHRVLRRDGYLVATVIVDSFYRHLWPYRLLHRLGWAGLASVYVHRMQARLKSRYRFSRDTWLHWFARKGFAVEQSAAFFPPRAIGVWSILALTPFRAFGALSWIRSPRIGRFLGKLVSLALLPWVRGMEPAGPEGGMLLVVARKVDRRRSLSDATRAAAV